MRRKSMLAAASALAAAAAVFGACRADDTAGNSRTDSTTTHAASKPAAAQPAPSVVAQAPAEDAKRVTVDEARKMLDSGKAVIYDTRAKEAYEQEHIKGSLSMPYGEVANRVGELPKDKTIVFYCTWPNEHTSAGAVLTAKSKGVDNAAALLGGMAAWKEAKLPTEGTNVGQK